MTIRGPDCMEDSAADASQPNLVGTEPANTGYRGNTGHQSAENGRDDRQAVEFTEQDISFHQEGSERFKSTDNDDELPLGSEANSLKGERQAVTQTADGYGLEVPVDKRLHWLRQGETGPIHSGWTSFNSDTSVLTSGSSANSVEWLLQGRQANPEEVLHNLGFGCSIAMESEPIYSRVPERFMRPRMQDAEFVPDVDLIQEIAEGPGRRVPFRADVAWRMARSVSSMMGLRALSSLQQAVGTLGSGGHGSNHSRSPARSSPSVTPPGRLRSVLHPDNQRALARRGFYGDMLPEGLEAEFLEFKGNKEDEQWSNLSAKDRRRTYQSVRSKQQWSLVESGGDEGIHASESTMKSVDYSTTESVDSILSEPTTPGDVFIDHRPPPQPVQTEAVTNIEDLFFPEHGYPNGSIKESRIKMTEKLMNDLDNDDNYFVSPPNSRQSTVIKSPHYRDATDGSLDHSQSGQVPSVTSSSSASDNNNVKIVVSQNVKTTKPLNNLSSGSNFLSIVKVAVDRLSDSGSEHTLVDYQSNSRSESPQPLKTGEKHQSKYPEFRDLEEGPIIFHKKGRSMQSQRDENDNVPCRQSQVYGHKTAGHLAQDDLSRMGSIHSDSSGFGDAEVIGENTLQDAYSLKVSSLGSSCESNATITTPWHDNSSNATLTPRDSFETRHLTPSDPSAQRFVTYCFIPPLGKDTRHTNTVISKSTPSAMTVSNTELVLGKNRASVAVPANPHRSKRSESDSRSYSGLKNERPLSVELAQAEFSSSLYRAVGGIPKLALQQPTLDSGCMEGSSSADELDQDDRGYASWQHKESYYPVRESASTARAGMKQHRMSSVDEVEYGSGASVTSSVYSCASTSDSINSSSGSDLVECQKLIQLINQPTSYKGRKTQVVQFKPKRHLRDWPGLPKRKRLQEEAQLALAAVKKFKMELSVMETNVMVKYQMVEDEMSPEERDEIEELQCLWTEVRHQILDTEQLLNSRIKAISMGNDNFNFLSTIAVLQRLIDLLKEQIFQSQISIAAEKEEEVEDRWKDRFTMSRTFSPRHLSSSWSDFPLSPNLRGHYSSSISHLPLASMIYPETSFEQFRTSLLSEVRNEMRHSLQNLQQDLQNKDGEIQTLKKQLLEQQLRRARSSKVGAKSLQPLRRAPAKETDV